MEKTYASIQTSLTVTVIVGLFFIGLGYLNSKKITNNKNYIVGDRDENTFSLTASLTASALGAWILFGPASAATWGGIGAVIGYALGTAAPMLLLYNFGPKIRKEFPNGLTLTESSNDSLNEILNETVGLSKGDTEEYPTMGVGVFDSSRASELLGYGDTMMAGGDKEQQRNINAAMTMKEAGVKSEQVPESLVNALTRDYSDLMKHDKFKGKK